MDLAVFDKIKSTLRTGDCLLYTGPGLVQSAIEHMTRSPYYHAGLVMSFREYPQPTLLLTIEAEAQGVVMSMQNDKGGCTLFPLKSPSWTYRREIGLRALRRLGMAYDFRALFGLLFGKAKPERGR